MLILVSYKIRSHRNWRAGEKKERKRKEIDRIIGGGGGEGKEEASRFVDIHKDYKNISTTSFSANKNKITYSAIIYKYIYIYNKK